MEADCFLALTSRTPQFKRDDVADRTVILTVARPGEFIPESVLNVEVQNDRNALMSAIFAQLNEVIC